jgi:hypothetical protein
LVSAPIGEDELAPALLEHSAPHRWRISRRSLLIGVVAFAAIVVLRHEGLLTGYWSVSLAALCFIFAPGPRRVSDRFLLTFAIGVGWLPLVGWVPDLELKVDVPGIVLAIAFGVTCGYQSQRIAGPRAVSVPTPAEAMPLVAGVAVTAWWWLPFSRLSLSGTLQALFSGWDNNSHFSMFRQNLQLGSFIQVNPDLPNGVSRMGYDYPQGIHQTWALFTRLLNPRPPSNLPWLLHSYLDMLLLTVGGIVVVGCMAVARLSRRDLLVALPAMAIVVALFGVGILGPFNGFPNYELAIAAAAVSVSLMIRPTLDPRLNFVAVAGMGLIVVYNWYPLVALIAPAIVIAALRARATGNRRVMEAVIITTALGYVLPALFFLHRGASTLNLMGSEVATPWGLLVLCLGAVVCVAYFRNLSRPDVATNLIIGAVGAIGGGAVLVIGAYEVHSVGGVSYYGQKLASGVFGISALVLVYVLTSDVALAKTRWRHTMPALMSVLVALILTVAALQVDGYVGPYTDDVGVLSTANGLGVRSEITQLASRSDLSEQLLLGAQAASRERGGQSNERWWYVVPNIGSGDLSLLGQWFIQLVGDPSEAAYNRAGVVIGSQFGTVASPGVAVRLVMQDFPNPVVDRIHLCVPAWLRAALIKRDPIWSRPGQLVTAPWEGSELKVWPQ